MTPETPPPSQEPPGPQVRDRQPRPPGVMPAALQTWAMLGLAAVIVVIVLATQGTPSRPPKSAGETTAARPTPQSTVGDFRARLEQQERQLAEARRQLAEQQALLEEPVPHEGGGASGESTDPYAAIRQEQIRREYDSLFTGPVAYSSTQNARPASPGTGQPDLDPALLAALTFVSQQQKGGAVDTAPAAVGAAQASAGPAPSAGESPSGLTPPLQSDGPWHRLLEGTILEAVLTTRLDGEFNGPAQAMVTTPVYSHDARHLVVPAGARLLGEARAVTSGDQQRLAVGFHRLVWPDGRTIRLDHPPALNAIGETGLRDRVNQHYLSIFGSAIAVAAISGLANVGFGLGRDNTVVVRTGTGGEQAATRILDRFLNRRPTITIREGHRLRVLLTADLDLPTYEPGTVPDRPMLPQPQEPSPGGRP